MKTTKKSVRNIKKYLNNTENEKNKNIFIIKAGLVFGPS